MEMKPIGYMQSVFKYKNGTPRQPMLCENARGILRIEKSIFNNPEHSLEDLDKFSHVWILFIFHKNSSSVTKAKVKPPRLDGRRVGVFSTRSPHRPNPIGLTLARLDKVEGSCIYLSGIDILDGTPILDVKPYIHKYDTPTLSPPCPDIHCTIPSNIALENSAFEKPEDLSAKSVDAVSLTKGHQEEDSKREREETMSKDPRPNDSSHQSLAAGCTQSTNEQDFSELTDSLRHSMCVKNKTEVDGVKEGMCANHLQNNEMSIGLLSISDTHSCSTSTVLSTEYLSAKKDVQLKKTHCSEELKISGDNACRTAAAKISSSWIPEINTKLHVRFTERAESQLKLFSKKSLRPEYRLGLLEDFSQLRRSIISILSEDPRSVYRRHKCQNSLYYFTVDTAHVTCWFDGNTAEIVRVQSIELVKELLPDD